jgi:GGDEF domain-containing protein
MGAFSARHSRDEILTVFPHKDVEEARKLVQDFSQVLQNGVIERMRKTASAKTGAACFEIYIRAGVIEVSPSDSIEQIIEKGREKQEIISKYSCDLGGNA